MKAKQFFRCGSKILVLVLIMVFLLSNLSFSNLNIVLAQRQNPGRTLTGEFLIVTNTTETVNGDVSNPSALITNPGPDGISLTEAMLAAEATSGYDTITFDPSLSGSVINIVNALPFIFHGNLTIDGNIDSDTSPDITLDGTNTAGHNGFDINGASHVVIKGLTIQNFKKHGINVTPDKVNSASSMEDLVFIQNTITNMPYAAINLGPYAQDHVAIHNVEIASNTFLNNKGGVSVIAGMGTGASDNEITGISIVDNTISNPGYDIGIFVSTSASPGLSRNSISDLEIRGNLITDHTNSSILFAGSNDPHCNDNTVDGVIIAENTIDGAPVTIEFVTTAGWYATGNLVTNVTITDNLLTSGGIQFGGTTGYLAHDNTTSNVVIERNSISSSAANGIYLAAGSDGAYNNLFENIELRDNFIEDSRDAGILLHANDSFSPGNVTRNVIIANQTIVNNGVGSSWASGININSKYITNIITGVNISNTILWGNGFGDVIRGSIVPDSVTYSILADPRFLGTADNIYQSPEFVDPSTGDYHLQSTSPCVDSGDPVSTVLGAKDLDHNIRVWDGNNDTISVVDRGAWEYASIAMQEIAVKGDGVAILNGDRVPATWDLTDFGSATLSEEPVQQIFSIENTGAAALNLTGVPQVEISGANAVDFSILTQPASQVNGGGSITFTVAFNPTATGLRTATLSISSNDSDENPYTFAIQGMGIAPTFRVFLPLILRLPD